MSIDLRATKAIKVCMNKLFGSKNACHLDIAAMITDFSHRSNLKREDRFESSNNNFFVITKVLSPYFVSVLHIPPVRYMFTPTWQYMYCPNYKKMRSGIIKRVFDPFGEPYLKHRGKMFPLQGEFSHITKLRRYYGYEPIQNNEYSIT